MPTKTTDKLPTVDEAQADLEAALDKLQATRSAVVANTGKVGPGDIAAAREAVEFAELRLELATDAERHQHDQAHQERIAQIVADLATGETAAKGRQVVELEAQVVAALEALYLAARDFHGATTARLLELDALGPLPDGVRVGRLELEVGPARFPARQGKWVTNVVRSCLFRSLKPHIAELGDSVELYDYGAKVLHGGIHEEKRTPAEVLAEQYERLEREGDR